MSREQEIVGYRGKSGKLGAYKCAWRGKGKDGTDRAKLVSMDGTLEFFVDAAKLEAAPVSKSRHGGCECDSDCCRPYCRCDSHCNCQGGNIYDC